MAVCVNDIVLIGIACFQFAFQSEENFLAMFVVTEVTN